MTDFIEYIPRRHGQKPDYWTPDTLTGLDNKNYVRQPNWAWIAGTTYYVPYEAVHGRPRPAPVDEAAATNDDLVKRMREAELDGYGYLVALLDEGANRIEALQADKAKLRGALTAARDHLEYCGYGDHWERECADAQGLPSVIEAALQETGQ